MGHTFRSLRSHIGLSATIVGTLAIALAFVMASVGILNGLLLHPYPYPKLRQLMLVRDAKPRDGAHQTRSIAVGDFLDARANVPAFASLVAWRPQPLVITNPGADPERVQAIAATANFFTTLGITPISGVAFPPNADTAGQDAIVLLSRRLWNSRFGADSSVIGRNVGLNGRPMTVIGIIRDEDCYPPGVDAWIPLVFSPSERTDRASQRIAALGRLAPAATEAEAAAQLASLTEALASRYPETNRGRGFELLPLRREQYEFTAPLFLFILAASTLVLLLAVINVANLLVARTLDRRRELAVRAMLGASGAQVARIALGEIFVLTAIAIAGGALAAGAVLEAIRASLPGGIARWLAGWSSLRIDDTAVMSGVAVGALAGCGISLILAIISLRAMRDSGGSSRATRRTTWGRRLLVAGEVGLAAALLLCASVMIAGFNRIAAAFEELAPGRLLKFSMTLPESRYPDAIRIREFHDAVLDRVRALPEVESAALIRNEPASNVPNPIVAFQRDDAPVLQPRDMPRIDVEVVSPSVFETLRLEILDGRALTDTDGADAPRVAVISQAAARRFWPDRNPVDAVIHLETTLSPVRVVGVSSDFRLNWYDPEMRPVIFLPDAQAPARTTSVIVRTRTEPVSLARPIRAAVAQLDDRQPLTEIESLSATISDSLSPIRIIERLLLIGAALASALAVLGIYGVLAHWVGARQRELGVRFALGATRMAIARFVLTEAALTAGGGIMVGVALAIALVRVAADALLGVPSLDGRSVAIVAISALVIAMGGAMGPARRAARVNAVDLLRS